MGTEIGIQFVRLEFGKETKSVIISITQIIFKKQRLHVAYLELRGIRWEERIRYL
jgi:hypothetical protein